MLGNPNTPQGERSLEDTEKESEEEGATAGAGEEMWFLREWAWVSRACGSGALRFCSTGLCWGKLSPSLHPRDGKQRSWTLGLKQWPLMVMFSDRLQFEEQVRCPLFLDLC